MNIPMTQAGTPDYIPPHLQGQVSDFRPEDDGGISFYHPAAALGISPEESRIKLSPEQAKHTFDSQHRTMNFSESMQKQYTPDRQFSYPGQRLSEWVAGGLRNAYDWGTSSRGKAVGTAGLLGAGAGTLGGLLLGRYTGGDYLKKALLMALLAGGLGAAGTAYGQHRLRKQGASMDPGVAEIVQAVESDYTLNSHERGQMLRAIARLSSTDRGTLSSMLRTVVGAGAGVIVARFLRSKGLLPMVVGGILGGVLGHASAGPKNSYNALGQPVLSLPF